MGDLGKNSCFQRLSSSERGFVDVSKQLLANDTSRDELDQLFQLIPDSIWHEIDDIIKSAEVTTTTTVTTNKQQNCKLVRKRKYREVSVGTRMDYSYGLEKRACKRSKMQEVEFLKPKTYRCDYCPADMLNVQVYLRHLRRHREAELRNRKSRCNSCGSLFNNVIETKWHQTQCLRRSIVSNL